MTEINDTISAFSVNHLEKPHQQSKIGQSSNKKKNSIFRATQNSKNDKNKVEECNIGNGLKRALSPIHHLDSHQTLTQFNDFDLTMCLSPTKDATPTSLKKKRKKFRKGYTTMKTPKEESLNMPFETNETIFNSNDDHEDFESHSSSEVHDHNFWKTFNTDRTDGSKLRRIHRDLDGKSFLDHHHMNSHRKVKAYKNQANMPKSKFNFTQKHLQEMKGRFLVGKSGVATTNESPVFLYNHKKIDPTTKPKLQSHLINKGVAIYSHRS